MEKIVIEISKEKLQYPYIDLILEGNKIEICGCNVRIFNEDLFGIILDNNNQKNIDGEYYIAMTRAYIKLKRYDEVFVELVLSNEPVNTALRIYNEEKYVGSEVYKYLKSNKARLINAAKQNVIKNINDNEEVVEEICEMIKEVRKDEKIFLMHYLKNNIGRNGKEVYNDMVNERRRLVTVKFGWIGGERSDERMAQLIFFVNYINLHSLKGIVFIDKEGLKTVKEYGEDIESGKDRERDKEKENKNDGKKNDKENLEDCVLLGAYTYLENENVANYLLDKYVKEKLRVGKYIFICPEAIEEFAKNAMGDIFEEMPIKCFDKNDNNCRICKECDCIKNMDVLKEVVKIVFLHEVGHMAFSNCSRTRNVKAHESAANWFASMCMNRLYEICMMREMTKFQPDEYKNFFTSPMHLPSIKNKNIEDEDRVRDEYERDCERKRFRTLDNREIDVDKYYDLVRDMINELYQ